MPLRDHGSLGAGSVEVRVRGEGERRCARLSMVACRRARGVWSVIVVVEGRTGMVTGSDELVDVGGEMSRPGCVEHDHEERRA